MKSLKLKPSFFHQPTLELARGLLGKILVHETTRGSRVSGRIIEVEAYLPDDAASHSYRGPTPRNQSMFRSAGTAYVYLIYGMYYCVNVVSEPEGIGAAVLIRALEPLEGIELMKKRRGLPLSKDLCSGPGKLCQALQIRSQEDGRSLLEAPLYLEDDGTRFSSQKIGRSSRIGITQNREAKLRFFIKNNEYLSR